MADNLPIHVFGQRFQDRAQISVDETLVGLAHGLKILLLTHRRSFPVSVVSLDPFRRLCPRSYGVRSGNAARNFGAMTRAPIARDIATESDSAGSVSSGKNTSPPSGFGGSSSAPVISFA